jgi:poly-gamma-glutamate synthesis protein (capsule biosynthesis protein)
LPGRPPRICIVALGAAVTAACAGGKTPERTAEGSVAGDGAAARAPAVAPPVSAPTASAAPELVEGPIPQGYLAFTGACTNEPVVVVAAIGDVLLHHELQKQAYASKDRFRTLWPGVADLLAAADVTYANLEVPIARGVTKDGEAEDPGLEFDNAVYTGYPFFNAHPSLALDLAATGIDIVSTANNHALDRGSIGLVRSLDALDEAKLAHAGTRRTTKDPFHAITDVKSRDGGQFKIAWIACTLHTNFGKDTSGQVLHCFKPKDRAKLLSIVGELAADPEIDAVVATPHWGKEYAPQPSDDQRELAQDLVDAGATAVLGAHPHVLQPWEILKAKDGGREAFVIYSLGNFAHHQRNLDRRSSIILYLALRADDSGNRPARAAPEKASGIGPHGPPKKTHLVPAGVGYVPIHVRMEGNKEKFFVEATDRVPGTADESRAHVIAVFGEPNLLAPDEVLARPSLARQCVRKAK